MVKTCAKVTTGLTSNSISLESDIERLRRDLINCPEYDNWDSSDRKLLDESSKLLESFLATNFSYKRAFQSAKKLLNWKVENEINSLRAESFPKEFHSVNFVTFIPADVNGTPTLLVRLCFPSPPSFALPFLYKYVAWNIERMVQTIRETSQVPRFIIDCADARIDLSIIKEMLNILVFIYPPWVCSITFANMDWKFTFIYKIIRQLLPSNIRELIVESDQSFVNTLAHNTDDLPPYLGGLAFNCSYEEYLNCDEMKDLMAERGFTPKQINEASDFFNMVIKKFGNDAPRKL